MVLLGVVFVGSLGLVRNFPDSVVWVRVVLVGVGVLKFVLGLLLLLDPGTRGLGLGRCSWGSVCGHQLWILCTEEGVFGNVSANSVLSLLILYPSSSGVDARACQAHWFA